MSENTDHITGGTFATDALIDEQTANTKLIIIQSANPTNPYDGVIFIDTDDNPIKIRVRDETNSQWMERRDIIYETGHNVLPSATPIRNGMFVVQYDATDAKTILWFNINNWWWTVTSG